MFKKSVFLYSRELPLNEIHILLFKINLILKSISIMEVQKKTIAFQLKQIDFDVSDRWNCCNCIFQTL